jgi:26S proteasome regulatory subunit N5
LGKKINSKQISESGLEAAKILYYKYMVHYFIHEKDFQQVSKSHQIIFDTINKLSPEQQSAIDPTGNEKKLSFQNFVLYLLIAPYTNEKVDLMHIVEANYSRELDHEELIAKFVRKLLTFELMPLDEKEVEQ